MVWFLKSVQKDSDFKLRSSRSFRDTAPAEPAQQTRRQLRPMSWAKFRTKCCGLRARDPSQASREIRDLDRVGPRRSPAAGSGARDTVVAT